MIDRLEFILTPPVRVSSSEWHDVVLNCAARSTKVFGKEQDKVFRKTTPFIVTERCYSGILVQMMLDLTLAWQKTLGVQAHFRVGL